MMKAIERAETGETLLEIIIAVVVISIVFSAFFAAYSTGALTSTTHRSAAQSDAILRNAAEATKAAVRDECASSSASTPGATYAVTLPSVPAGWPPLSVTPADNTCPAVPTTSTCPPTTSANASTPIPCVKHVAISVTAPGAAPRTLTIQVRTP